MTPFDRDRAERAVVEVLWGLDGDRTVGMGVRLLPDVVATAARCLPHVDGRVRLPSPDDPARDPVFVRLRHPRTGRTALAAVVAADPCADFALLGDPARSPVPPPVAGLAPFEELLADVELAAVDPAPAREAHVLVLTHERRWIDGIASEARFSPRIPSHRIRAATSGAPLFDARGRVVALVGHNDVRLPDVTVCRLADHLPGWVLRRCGALLLSS